MDSRTFNIPKSEGTPKSFKTADATDVSSRHSVYNRYESPDGEGLGGVLRGMGELRATV